MKTFSTILHDLWSSHSQHAGLRSLLSNTGWLSIQRIVESLASLVVAIWVIRYLGPHDYGLLTYVGAYILILHPLSNLGLGSILSREFRKGVIGANMLFGSAIILRLLSGLLTYGLVIVVGTQAEGQSNALPLFFIIGLVYLFEPADIIENWLHSQMRNKYNFYSRSGALVVVSAMRIGAVLMSFSVTAFAWILVFEWMIKAIFLVLFGARNGLIFSKWRFSATVAGDLLRDSKFLMFNALILLVYIRIDHLMLRYLGNLEIVGVYGAASRIASTLFPFAGVIALAVTPLLISSFESGDKKKYVRQMQITLDVLILVTIPMTLLLAFGSRFFIDLVFGKAFEAAVPILQIHSCVLFFAVFDAVRRQWTVIENHVRFGLVSTLCGVILNVLLNFFFIPRWGGVGAASATLGAQAFVSFGLLMFLPRYRWLGITMVRSLLAPLRFRAILASLDILLQGGNKVVRDDLSE